jgi:hypothetical protein
MERLLLERFQNPLPLDQSILVMWPYLKLLAALALVCFGVSYAVFMRQESGRCDPAASRGAGCGVWDWKPATRKGFSA